MNNNQYQLDKVIILSRHGIRTPLENTIALLEQSSPLKWPSWDHAYGYLTTRGGVLEAFFGHYLSQWLEQKNINIEPQNPDIYVYANSLQRTVATAQFLVNGAFAGYDIPIHHKYTIEKMDPIFDPSVQDDSTELKQAVLRDIEEADKTASIFKNLAPAYQMVSDILDYPHSQLYARYRCDFADIPYELYFKKNEEPELHGPLAIGICAVDAFLLQYYSAFPKDQIAWGKITRLEQWQQILQIRNHYIDLVFHCKTIAQHISKLLINKIDDLLHHQSHKVNLLVGHDSTIAALLGALDFAPYQLPNQCENTPIGGMVIFQRYRHISSGDYFFRAEYVYQSFEQLYTGQPIDIHNPPQHYQLKLENAYINSDGYYNWADFAKRLKDN
ncbi:histidine-type phosphatase [Gilliamella sp. B2776]|uniref:histidine-type phosphatase n=1 Tax=unclassified Gilliamella TaxID=2685620 RepID=UPI00226A7A55|nr:MULTISPECIES: histidine-type phosphatase [unclassified Gilliamella]MCX8649226.1 histidine-type phosphatase [Gilliamella sp. B2779]MCX8655160.1 histidine-type phosphatase [Gilliamella sp. B2737]MCX8655932.1 histidine-type phosphatase [Gilliamella sp. B2894]MCX8691279.1 histidine-type phosphatase [Gilliamella sp. B2776]MCX8694523.1 histidine-type phosphatase [Gilliamella sp. B2881]